MEYTELYFLYFTDNSVIDDFYSDKFALLACGSMRKF